MAITSKLLAVAAIALAGCGDSGGTTDASIHHDGGNPDAPSFPAPPALGAQIDRAGRPLIGTALIGVFAADPMQTAMRTAYSQASDPATWAATALPNTLTIQREMEVNLAAFDAIDIGLNAVGPVPAPGCQNALLYTGLSTAYRPAGALLADDRIYVDTSHPTCPFYFALELEHTSSGTVVHNTCGGRAPSHDVFDMTYSVLAAGIYGLDLTNEPAPRIKDGAGVHPDVKDTFPFLGPP